MQCRPDKIISIPFINLLALHVYCFQKYDYLIQMFPLFTVVPMLQSSLMYLNTNYVCFVHTGLLQKRANLLPNITQRNARSI